MLFLFTNEQTGEKKLFNIFQEKISLNIPGFGHSDVKSLYQQTLKWNRLEFKRQAKALKEEGWNY